MQECHCKLLLEQHVLNISCKHRRHVRRQHILTMAGLHSPSFYIAAAWQTMMAFQLKLTRSCDVQHEILQIDYRCEGTEANMFLSEVKTAM